MMPFTFAPHRHRAVLGHRARSWVGVVSIAVACLAVEGVCRVVQGGSSESWYSTLGQLKGSSRLSSQWLFGPLWSTMHVTMAVAAGLVWLARDREDVYLPLIAFTGQLAAGLGWAVLFFGLGSPLAALLNLLLLLVMAGMTTGFFFKISRVAGLMLLPYPAWVSFAIFLNGSIVFILD